MSENNKSSKSNDEKIIDPQVEEEVKENRPEDPFFTNYASDSNSENPVSEKNDIASDFIGEGGDWRTKTFVSAEQIVAMSQARMLTQVFDELEPIENHIMETVENLEKYSVSHGGMSREQAVSVLKSMFSEDEYNENLDGGEILQAFAQVDGDNDE